MHTDDVRDLVAQYILELVQCDNADSLYESEELEGDDLELAYAMYSRAKVSVVIDEVEYNG